MQDKIRKPGFRTVAFLFLLAASTAFSSTHTWQGGEGDWFDAGQWSGGVPLAGGTVDIPSGTVHLTNHTESLSSLTLSGTLVFTNWNTTLSATNVSIWSGGVMTVPPAFTDIQMSNNVVVVCSNLTVAANATINVDGKGYAGGEVAQDGFGPGRGQGSSSRGGGGAYGGHALDGWSASYGGLPYGDAANPFFPGSGGGGGNRVAGAGGGAIRIEADGVVTVNGILSANGVAGTTTSFGGAGGSGGGIYIRCLTLDGTAAGQIRANGGDGPVNLTYSTSGGGGRIAVHYDSAVQTTRPAITFQTLPGMMGTTYRGDLGTLWFPDSSFLDGADLSGFYGQWMVDDFHGWATDELTFSDTWIRFPSDGFLLAVTNDLVGSGSLSRLEIGGGTLYTNISMRRVSSEALAPVVAVGGNLSLAGSARVALYGAAVTNPAAGGAFLRVTNTITIETGAVLAAYAHPTNGGSPVIEAAAVRVLAGGTIDAAGKGFGGAPIKAQSDAGFGPGAGEGVDHSGAGGGFGGFGGGAYFNRYGGISYGSAAEPLLPGSGGGRQGDQSGGNGGGRVRIIAQNVLVNGSITADGDPGMGPGGSGGAVHITCETLAGTNGVITICGGNSGHTWSGGGGGGRLAIDYDPVMQAAIGKPDISFWGKPGLSGDSMRSTLAERNPDIGTLWFRDGRFVEGPFTSGMSGQLVGAVPWVGDSLVVDNTWIRFAGDGVPVTVTNDVQVFGSSGKLELGGASAVGLNYTIPVDDAVPAVMTVGGNVRVSDAAIFNVYSAATNGTAPGYGALLDVSGGITVASNSWIHPHSHPVNGGAPLFEVEDLWVEAGGGFNADGLGWSGSTNARTGGFGPGGGIGTGPTGSETTGRGCAGGYGGRGGGSYYETAGGLTYGFSNAPAMPGSGGVPYQSARGLSGGGLIWVEATGTVAIDGVLQADAPSGAGPGSGGGIYLRCRRFTGSGQIHADGGDSNQSLAAGAGGGRIAVWRTHHEFNGLVTADEGTGATSGSARTWDPGKPGTIVWGWIPPLGTLFILR